MTSRSKAPGSFRWLCLFLVTAVTLGLAPAALAVTTVPGTPVMTTPGGADIGTEQVALHWSIPADGGSAITDYRVQYTLTGTRNWMTYPDGISTTAAATITLLTPNTSYDFRVRAGNKIGWGLWSEPVTAKTLANPTPGVPAQVVMTSATPDVDHVDLLWAIPADGGSTITDYRVQYRKVGDLAWATFPDGLSIANTATVTLLTANTSYDFRVRAGNAVGWGVWSTAIRATTLVIPAPTVPAQMAAPTATAQVEAVKLDWVAPATGGSAITDYRVQYRKVGDLTWVTFPDGVPNPPLLTVTVTFLDSDFNYEFRVRAGNINGWGAWSPASIAVKPLAVSTTLPGAPGTLVADTVLIFNSVHLVWGAASAPDGFPVTDYRVEYREVGAMSWVTYPDGASTSTSATVTLLVAGHQYEFRVKARNVNGWGPYSNTVTATPIAP